MKALEHSNKEALKLIRKLYKYIERHEPHLYWGGSCSKRATRYRLDLIKEASLFSNSIK